MLDTIQVIIPALDEEQTIGAVVEALVAQGFTRIRVMDNGSSDRTAKVAVAAGAEVMSEPRRGYGQACWRGYQQLDDAVDWVLFCDADGSDDPGDVERLVAAVAESEADFVLGDRRATALGRSAMTPVQRMGNQLATALIGWGWKQPYGDLGPLRLIRRSLLERMDMRDRGFGWTIEMQVRAAEEKARIVELPVGYRRRGGGRSKISGTIRGSVAAGFIILATLAALWVRRWNRAHHGYRLGGLVVLVGAGLMVPWGDFHIAGTVPWFLMAAAVMGAGWWAAGTPHCISPGWFWGVAILARLILLPMAPGDDIWRYLWEGRIQSAGFSPYLHAPADESLSALRDGTWEWINHPQATAIYPPVAQLMLRSITTISATVIAFKLAFIAADLMAVWLLTRRFGRAAAIIYAWNPLVIYVTAGGAHYEPALILAMVAGWLAWEKSEPGDHPSAWWLGVAAGLKWITVPMIAWCGWAQLKAGRWRQAIRWAVIAALPVGASLLVFQIDLDGVGSLAPVKYAQWARTAEMGPWLIERVVPWIAYQNQWMLLIFLPVAAWIFFRSRTLTRFSETFLAALLLFSPNVHAWYFVWLVPFAVASRNLGTRWVSVSGFVYFWLWESRATTGEWTQSPAEKLLLWTPFLLGFAWSRHRESRS